MPGKIIAPMLLLLSSCLLVAETGRTENLRLSLGETIEIALKHNPQIEIARQQYAATEGRVTQARSRFWPHVSTAANLGQANISNIEPDQDTFSHLQFQLTQLIWDFGRTTGLVDATGFNRQAAAENLKQAHHDVIYEVKADFYSVFEKKRLITVAKQAVDNYEQQLYRAQKYYESGVRTKIDVTNAEVNLSNQNLNLLEARSNLKAARVKLEKTLGKKPGNGDYELIFSEPELELLAQAKPELPGPLETLLETAFKNQPGLARYTMLVKAAESTLKQTRSDYWPSINASAEYHEYETDLSSLPDQWQLGVGLSWELFSGLETEGKVVEAHAQLREVKAALREYNLLVTQNVTDSFLRADENREAVEIASKSLKLSQENLNLADGRYKAGIGDLLEYNDAQLLYTQNQSSLVITYYNYLTALARIERAVGVMPEMSGFDIFHGTLEEDRK